MKRTVLVINSASSNAGALDEDVLVARLISSGGEQEEAKSRCTCTASTSSARFIRTAF